MKNLRETISDEQLRLLVRAARAHLGVHASPQLVKYVVYEALRKLEAAHREAPGRRQPAK